MTHNTTALKTIVIIAASCLALFALLSKKQALDDTPTIGIIQTASHPALDAACRGFISTVKHKLGEGVRFRLQNAEGIVAQAQSIAQQFAHDSSLRMIFSIATPAAQAALNAAPCAEHIFTAVTNTEVLDIDANTHSVTGCCDMIDTDHFVSQICAQTPTARSCALLHCQGEVGAIIMAKKLQEALARHNVLAHLVGFQHEAEIPVTVAHAATQNDMIICPIDNKVASGIECIARVASEQNTPLFVCDRLLMCPGVTGAAGVDYHQLGVQSGKAALMLLEGNKRADQIPVQQVTESTLVTKESK